MTLRVQQTTNFDPVDWDQKIFKGWQVTLDNLDSGAREYSSLRLLALITSQDKDRLAHALASLTDNALARGAHLMGLMALGRYTEVLLRGEEVFPTDIGVLSMFDAANANFAVALSAGALGHHEDALRFMHTAQALYAALRMERREQLINLEIERIRLALGTASPQRIIATMSQADLGEQRRKFSQHILAETYMIYGEYETAELIAPPGSGLSTFAEVLGGGRPGVFPPDDYGSLARALRDPEAEIPTLIHLPEKGYGHLIKALRLIKIGQSGQPQAFQLLVSFEPKSPDHKIWWGLMMMSISPGVPAARRYLDQALKLITEGRAGVTKQVPIISFLTEHAPFLLLLYAAIPESPVDVVDASVGLPLWTGNAVFWKGKTFMLRGGETGSCLLADDLRGIRAPARHPQEVTRFEKSRVKNLEITGPSTAISWLLKIMLLTAYHTHLNTAYWRDKAAQLLPMLCGDDVQKAAQEVMSQDCASMGLGSKIML
ncbi:hypothetical protein [Deinococcus sp. Leaf326]|jgi:hypothetical protein|uniref:hypothetical protein n=1 Tax=Deinococcus sp. Leaf326 TaxID=1736338 RepID=UPI0007135AE4|nr:hypothetical protein [Deinococcus sp. Leaf326]KQR37779.1 hypothetical protein ASF71_14960 [Deinococcus sp. Leaf326]